jgi:hypothetical protein
MTPSKPRAVRIAAFDHGPNTREPVEQLRARARSRKARLRDQQQAKQEQQRGKAKV